MPYLAIAKTFERIEEESKRFALIDVVIHSISTGLPLTKYASQMSAVCPVFSRLKIVSTLTNFFRSVILLSPMEMVQCVYLCLNKVDLMKMSQCFVILTDL